MSRLRTGEPEQAVDPQASTVAGRRRGRNDDRSGRHILHGGAPPKGWPDSRHSTVSLTERSGAPALLQFPFVTDALPNRRVFVDLAEVLSFSCRQTTPL